MFWIHEMPFWVALGCLVLSGCAEPPPITPCATDTDCPATRTCVDGRCRFIADDAGERNDAGNPSNTDSGCNDLTGSTTCCRTDTPDGTMCCGVNGMDQCPPGSICQGASEGTTGSCVACDASARTVCADADRGRLTFGSECEAIVAGATNITNGACRCGLANPCEAGQVCDEGVRHQRDCGRGSDTMLRGVCVVARSDCDELRRQVGCDGRVFVSDCARLSAAGMSGGGGARFALDASACPALVGDERCYDDGNCLTGQSCYGQRDECVPGVCRDNPDATRAGCYDATDCFPWQSCSGRCPTLLDCEMGTCADTRLP